MRWPLLRLTFAIWWKLLAALFLIGFLRGLLGYLLPWGQMSFWLASILSGVPILGGLMWKMLSGMPDAAYAAIAWSAWSLMLFAILHALLRLHVGRRYGSATLAWRTSPAFDLNLFD